jgi:hypothetical protein
VNNAALKAFRALAGKPGYPYQLTFTREFTKGSLMGLTHEDTVGFCTEADAEEWVAAVNRNNAAGKVNYRVIKWGYVKIQGTGGMP